MWGNRSPAATFELVHQDDKCVIGLYVEPDSGNRISQAVVAAIGGPSPGLAEKLKTGLSGKAETPLVDGDALRQELKDLMAVTA